LTKELAPFEAGPERLCEEATGEMGDRTRLLHDRTESFLG
jgi:hypothetical protein